LKLNSPLEVYKYLPQTNCKECGEETCMAFAAKLIDRDITLDECTPLLEEGYAEKYEELKGLMAPEVREVVIGTGENTIKIGGDDVLYRHKLTFFDATGLFYDVWDTMGEEELVERVNEIQNFKKFYVGAFITLDGIAIRSTSGAPEKFASTVKKVCELSDMPMVLCSFDADVLEAGLEVAGDRNPLLYAATSDNWQQMMKLAAKHDVPLVLSSFGDLDLLKSMATTFASAGMEKIVLDPGTFPVGKGLRETFENFLKLRRAAIGEGDRKVAYPLMGVPSTAWLAYEDEISASYWETLLAGILIIKYADILLLHSTLPSAILPVIHIKDTMYTDPRTPVKVDGGIREVGSPSATSPVFVTTNFALTYYTVESDLSSNSVDCYIVVVDTDGIGVEAAVAGGQLTCEKIKDALEKGDFNVKEKTEHGSLVIPGLAARLQGELEDVTGLKVLVGPQDSGRIPGWIEKSWNSA